MSECPMCQGAGTRPDGLGGIKVCALCAVRAFANAGEQIDALQAQLTATQARLALAEAVIAEGDYVVANVRRGNYDCTDEWLRKRAALDREGQSPPPEPSDEAKRHE